VWNLTRAALVAALALMAVLTFAHGLEARYQSIAMEKYWFHLGASHKLDANPTHVALEPGAEITFRPSLRPGRP
jgi:hypothetical protein